MPGAFAWRDPHFRELLDRFARSADAREMIKLAKEMDRMIVEHAIAFPCRYLLAAPLLKPWVKLPPVWRAGFTHFKHAVILPH